MPGARCEFAPSPPSENHACLVGHVPLADWRDTVINLIDISIWKCRKFAAASAGLSGEMLKVQTHLGVNESYIREGSKKKKDQFQRAIITDCMHKP